MDKRAGTEQAEIPLPEWIVAALGFALVATLLVYLARQTLIGSEAPPLIRLQAGAVQEQEGRYLVEVEVTNAGPRTAAGLTVEGRLYRGRIEVEATEAELDYAPAHSRRRVGMYFRQDPRLLRLELSPRSYQEP